MLALTFTLAVGAASKPKLNFARKTMTVKSNIVLKVKGKKIKKVTFKSSNKKVASVNKKGVVSAKSVGKTTIIVKVKLKNKKKKTLKCRIQVIKQFVSQKEVKQSTI